MERAFGGIIMITVRRNRKRNLNRRMGRAQLIALCAVGVALIALCVTAFAGQRRLSGRLDNLADYMAKSVRTDLNQAVQACGSLNRRSAEAAGDTLNNMKRYVYAAYRTNQMLVAARGESYSIIDTATYNNFQTLVGEYERLLANGQSTSAVRTSLNEFMDAVSTTLASRFDSADLLLPQTAARQPGR